MGEASLTVSIVAFVNSVTFAIKIETSYIYTKCGMIQWNS